jgi:hypothetical protein
MEKLKESNKYLSLGKNEAPHAYNSIVLMIQRRDQEGKP